MVHLAPYWMYILNINTSGMCNIIITTIVFLFNRKTNASQFTQYLNSYFVQCDLFSCILYKWYSHALLWENSPATKTKRVKYKVCLTALLRWDETRWGVWIWSCAELTADTTALRSHMKKSLQVPPQEMSGRSDLHWSQFLDEEGLLRPHPEWEVKSWGERPTTCNTETKLKRNSGPHKR